MIHSKSDLQYYIQQDALASGRKSTKAQLLGDEIWKYQLCLRKLEYCTNTGKHIARMFYKFRLHRLSVMLGFEIPLNVCEEGLSLAHRGTIIISDGAKIGKYCRIHEGVTIGATNGSGKAATIGDNVFIATGAKVIGEVSIANDCAIAANAAVVKDIPEAGTTWGGTGSQDQRSRFPQQFEVLFAL